MERYIDHTLLKPNATIADIKKLCAEAKKYNFYAVCIHGCHASLVKKELSGTDVKLATVVGFPLGATSTRSKVFEARDGIEKGTDEIDMVINVGWLKSGEYELVREEIGKVKKAIGEKVLKVIIETCYLTKEEIIKACHLVVEGDADFIKTSTGFGTGGATFDDVELIRHTVGNSVKIKASGGIKDRETALRYIELGVSRIGTSSGVAIVTSI